MRYPDRTLNKERFGFILTPVWQKAMVISNIVNGFSAVGLFPFNSNAIPDCAFLPSALTEKPAPEPILGDLEDDEPDLPDQVSIIQPNSSFSLNAQDVPTPSTSAPPSSSNAQAFPTPSLPSSDNRYQSSFFNGINFSKPSRKKENGHAEGHQL